MFLHFSTFYTDLSLFVTLLNGRYI